MQGRTKVQISGGAIVNGPQKFGGPGRGPVLNFGKTGGLRPPLFVRPCYVIANFGMCTHTLQKKNPRQSTFACVHLFKELCYYMLSFSLK